MPRLGEAVTVTFTSVASAERTFSSMPSQRQHLEAGVAQQVGEARGTARPTTVIADISGYHRCRSGFGRELAAPGMMRSRE